MQNKVAIVTGASKGLGASISKKLAQEGISVAVVYKESESEAINVAKECKKYNVKSITIKADVRIDSECKRIAEQTKKHLGNASILINNAGITKFVPFKNLDGLNEEDFLDIYKTNVVSAFLMTRAVLSQLKEEKNSKIVNISSVASLGLGSSIAYAVSKGAMNTLSLALSRTLAPGITVNTICPGYIKTNWHGNDEEVNNKAKIYADSVPLKKAASTEEVAETVFWFVNSSQLITGETLYVDGGLHLNY